MASLKRIHRMTEYLQTHASRGYPETIPKWISGRKLYEISGPDNSALGCHFSGLLRQCAYMLDFKEAERVMVKDESGNEYDLAILLDEAAERLDDAHEDWLEAQAPDVFKGWGMGL